MNLTNILENKSTCAYFMKPPLSDHEKEAIVKKQSQEECARILAAFEMGKCDKNNGGKNRNPYSKSRDMNRYTAYENGYKKS